MARMRSIELTNFKNVGHGKIEFPSASGKVEGADVVGIYGQNGSGKTAVIEALSTLDRIFRGKTLSAISPDCVRNGCEEAELCLELSVADNALPENQGAAVVFYRVALGRKDDELFVKRERLSFIDCQKEKPRKALLFDHRVEIEDESDAVEFLTAPKTAWAPLLAASSSFATDFAVAERLSNKTGSSFMFSSEFIHALEQFVQELYKKEDVSKSVANGLERTVLPALSAMVELRMFSLNLSVLTTINNAGISLNNLAITPWKDPRSSDDAKVIWLDISKPVVQKKEELKKLEATIETINRVLVSLVPGLALGVKNLGDEMRDDGEAGTRIEVVSQRNGCTLPFRCESEGVKKIVSILGLLISVYSNENCCVAIDELDSGIFEFLLGEILEVLSEHGKGQIIFTAHNLRPLETLPPRSLVFTTTNPDHRYIGFTGLKKTNNLRDQYLRAINLGGQPEIIYEPTSKYEIDSAFFEAGCLEGELCDGEDELRGES